VNHISCTSSYLYCLSVAVAVAMAEANNNAAKELPSLQDLNNETVDLVIHPEN
jgi:hypothetical protein